jgi:hypothetical protein
MTGNGVIRFYRNIVGAVVTNPITGFAASRRRPRQQLHRHRRRRHGRHEHHRTT